MLDWKAEEIARYREMLQTDARVVDGVIRWSINNRVPPAEVLAAGDDLFPLAVLAKSAEVRDRETAEFLAEYRRREKNRKPSAEELYEMRAAFGPGATVVNVVTGSKIRL